VEALEVAVGVAAPRGGCLHLHPGDAVVVHPLVELVDEPVVGAAGEAAAAVDRDAIVGVAEKG
jgi:hypothetical protein